jgi:hypothetical protein
MFEIYPIGPEAFLVDEGAPVAAKYGDTNKTKVMHLPSLIA